METTAPPLVPADAKPRKRSSVRHTRAIQRDRRQRLTSAPPAEAVAERLTEIVHPATLAQVSYFHLLGLRARVLSLPVMMGLVLGLLWRQIGGVMELVRVVGGVLDLDTYGFSVRILTNIISVFRNSEMAFLSVCCPHCQGDQVVKRGTTAQGKQRYLCQQADCPTKTFILDYSYNGYLPEVKKQIIDMAMNGSGIRDTARVLNISPSTVISEIKKKNPVLNRSTTGY